MEFRHGHQWYKELRSKFRHRLIAVLSVVYSGVSSVQVRFRLWHGHHNWVVEFLFLRCSKPWNSSSSPFHLRVRVQVIFSVVTSLRPFVRDSCLDATSVCDRAPVIMAIHWSSLRTSWSQHICYLQSRCDSGRNSVIVQISSSLSFNVVICHLELYQRFLG